jgi:NTE family protein
VAKRTRRLAAIEAFKDLSASEHDELESRLQPIAIARGEILVRQGDAADALYLVMSGRFQVLLEGRDKPISEIGPGSPVGEIAFFSGGLRTATVKAGRDSLVLRLTREDFERLAARSPSIWVTITSVLARRLAETTSGEHVKRQARPRTIAICRAGAAPIPEAFLAKLREVFESNARTIVLDEVQSRPMFRNMALRDSEEGTRWFNELESRCDFVLYVAENELTQWSQKTVRQADLVLCVGQHGPGLPAAALEPSTLERFAVDLHQPGNVRLVMLHRNAGGITGTRAWLERRPWLSMHHHVALDSEPDYQRLFRFVNGTALGLVACGGGAFSAAHIGLYEALVEAGLEFDIMGGTSGGGAMTAAFALGADPDEIERRTHDMFVTRGALRRLTWPRYSLLDHTELDQALALNFTSVDIEDLWIPYFALSTNLSRNASHCHRSGPLWEAVRATSAVPALLPPFFTAEGEMLVDGCLLDNVPVETMRSLKSGPNVVIDFSLPRMDRYKVDYRALPSRSTLLRRIWSRSGRRGLPLAPTPQAVLMRSLMLNRRELNGDLGHEDILLSPRIPAGVGPLDWHKHRLLREKGYEFARAELARLRSEGHPLLNGHARS